jgi:hypothetical protein
MGILYNLQLCKYFFILLYSMSRNEFNLISIIYVIQIIFYKIYYKKQVSDLFVLFAKGSFVKGKEASFELSNLNSWMAPIWSAAIFLSFYNFGIGPISWSLLADSFPLEIRYMSASIIGK